MLARIRDVTFKQSTSSTKILQFTVSIWKLEYKRCFRTAVIFKNTFIFPTVRENARTNLELETTNAITHFIRWLVSNTRGHLTQC